MRKVGEIYSETDYRQFKSIPYKRKINEAKVQDLELLFSSGNWVGYPILVTKELEIIDGYHRFEAAKRAGVPIQYMVTSEKLTPKQLYLLHQCDGSYSTEDFIYVMTMGTEKSAGSVAMSYRRLMGLMDKCRTKNVTDNVIACAVTGKHKGVKLSDIVADELRGKSFSITDKQVKTAEKLLPKVDKWCKFIRKASPKMKKTGPTNLCIALLFVAQHPDFNEGRFEKKLNVWAMHMGYAKTTEECVEQIQTMYNKRSSSVFPEVDFITAFKAQIEKEEKDSKKVVSTTSGLKVKERERKDGEQLSFNDYA